MSTLCLGIDPGFGGAVAAENEAGQFVDVQDMQIPQ